MFKDARIDEALWREETKQDETKFFKQNSRLLGNLVLALETSLRTADIYLKNLTICLV